MRGLEASDSTPDARNRPRNTTNQDVAAICVNE